jgi:serine/threonine protein kinase
MKPERFQQVETIFQAALKRDPANRVSFLDGACLDDDELRSEVESLLAAHDEAGSFIHLPAVEIAAELMADEQSDALINHTLGQYKIIAKIGAGGMGEVYLAQDMRLGRKVALKVLPDYFTSDKDRLTRFNQEARAASALNHPNIITIHEIGEASASHFIATEFIEGKTLREVIASRSLKLTEALDVAIQAASALAAAHAAGIVHRDIKPENIMLRPDGYVKVLDFGLAKLTEGEALNTSTDSPTIMKVSTNPGVVMGTASYMSPEQARGQRVDGRTDVWSLGVVLYEAVTSHSPFAGETTSDVIAAILERQPAPLARYALDAPAQLQWIVSKALRKEKDERYQTIKEMLSDLKDLRYELEAQARAAGNWSPERSSEASSPGAATAGGQRLVAATMQEAAVQTGEAATRHTSSAEVILSEIKKHKAGAVGIVALLVIIIAALGFGLYRFEQSKSNQPSPDAASQAIKIMPFPADGNVNAAAISPDGKYVVYSLIDPAAAGQSLWVKHLPTNSAVQIFPLSKNLYWDFTFTPDSNYFYYRSKDKDEPTVSLNKLPVVGGAPKKLIADFKGDSPKFSPDGRQVAFLRSESKDGATHLMIANEDGSNERMLLSRRGDEWFENGIAWSPDGKTLACFATSYAYQSRSSLVVVKIEDGSSNEIGAGRWYRTNSLVWQPDGKVLILAAQENSTDASQIWRVTYPDGEVRRLTSDLNSYESCSLTADGNTLSALQHRSYSDIWVQPFGASGDKLTQITFSKTDSFGRWTPDGKMVFNSNAGGYNSLWVMNADGTNRRQLTSGADDRSPGVSPDGRRLVFGSHRSGNLNLWSVDIDGSNLRPLPNYSSEDSGPRYTPDGKWIVFYSWRSGKVTIWKIPAEGGEAVQLTTKSSWNASPSPDSKLVACYDAEAPPGTTRILILPIEGGEPTQVIELPQNSSNLVEWTPDARAIIYHHWQGDLNGIWKQPLAGGKPVLLTSYKREPDRRRVYSLSPDGKQWAITRSDSFYEFVLITNFK